MTSSKSARSEVGCLWCGAREDLSNEHVIPQWMSMAFADRFWAVSPNLAIKGAHRWQDGDDSRRSPMKRIDILVPTCRACNNGWMSVLEERARPILTSLVFGESVDILDVD